MTTLDTPVEISDNPGRSRWEALTPAGDVIGFLEYERRADTLVMPHTEVAGPFGGQGIAGQLAKAALDAALEAGDRIVPVCPYVKGYIERHPEYQDLVAG